MPRLRWGLTWIKDLLGDGAMIRAALLFSIVPKVFLGAYSFALVRILVREQFAAFILAQSSIFFLVGMVSGPMALLASSEGGTHGPWAAKDLRRQTLLALLGCGLLFVIFCIATNRFSAGMLPIWGISALALAALGGQGVEVGIANAAGAHRAIGRSAMGQALVTLFSGVPLTWMFGAPGALLGMALGGGLGWYLLARGTPNVASERPSSQRFHKGVLALLIAGVLVPFANWIAFLWVAGNAQETTIYGLGLQWRNFLTQIPISLAMFMIPRTVRALREKGEAATVRSALLQMALLGTLTLVLGTLSWLPLKVYLTARRGGLTHWEVPFLLLLGSGVFISMQGVIGNWVVATRKYSIALWANLLWAGLFIGLSTIWGNSGALGLGAANLFSFLIYTFAMFVWVKRKSSDKCLAAPGDQ